MSAEQRQPTVDAPWMGPIHVQVLGLMVRNHGVWPTGVKPNVRQRQALNALARKDIVRETAGAYRLAAS